MPDVETVYPFLEDGLQFLRDKEAVDGKQFRSLSQVQKLRVIGSSTIASAGAAAQLRSFLAESHKAGEDARQFRARIKDQVELLKSDANRILRTSSKQAYIEGLTKTLEKPHIDATFGYVIFTVTHDGRTRPAHAKFDGVITKVGSALYREMLELLREWNCRCSLIPLTAKQAKARGFAVDD